MSMIETPLYSSIEYDILKEKIITWPFHQITDEVRLHYKVIKDEEDPEVIGCGFHFCSIKETGRVLYDGKLAIKYPDNPWQNPTTTAEVLLHGVAYFDGIRHLYFGTKETKNHAYFFYPDMEELILIMKKLVELEDEYCKDLFEGKE